eukprot:TRINITY_DN44999_c0_g1_i1.p2 TRINITY_DN44999_c0_g1~~TRINITY_DN44999_c0_g1_i1.p2  ORF type:complete len:240 (-),score=-17.25 TRINITY_DN44999_c0_g1_i1:281-928(-)
MYFSFLKYQNYHNSCTFGSSTYVQYTVYVRLAWVQGLGYLYYLRQKHNTIRSSFFPLSTRLRSSRLDGDYRVATRTCANLNTYVSAYSWQFQFQQNETQSSRFLKCSQFRGRGTLNYRGLFCQDWVVGTGVFQQGLLFDLIAIVVRISKSIRDGCTCVLSLSFSYEGVRKYYRLQYECCEMRICSIFIRTLFQIFLICIQILNIFNILNYCSYQN